MRVITRLLALAALGLTVVPAILFAAGRLDDASMKTAMLIGTVLWFATAPLVLKGGD